MSAAMYAASWPILDETRDMLTVADLKRQAERDLVVMLHDAGLIPVARPKMRVSPDRAHLVAAVRVIRRPQPPTDDRRAP